MNEPRERVMQLKWTGGSSMSELLLDGEPFNDIALIVIERYVRDADGVLRLHDNKLLRERITISPDPSIEHELIVESNALA